MVYSNFRLLSVQLIKSVINNALYKLAPNVYWKRRLDLLRRVSGEPELRYLPILCDVGKQSVDVGADDGLYAVRMAALSQHCTAFEARPQKAALLQELVNTNGLNITVCSVALSDIAGTATLRILDKDGGRSTIEDANDLDDPDQSSRRELTVCTKTLDSYKLSHVGCIKIDVEGHESAVLTGSRETLKREMPNLIIEAEERHKPGAVKDVFGFLASLGYAGYFILEGKLTSTLSFDVDKHQNPANIGGWKSGYIRHGVYVNNFIFVSTNNLSSKTELERAL